MRRTNIDVGTYLAGTGVVNIVFGAAEAGVLVSTGARRQKHFLRRRCHSHYSLDPAGHTDYAVVVDAEPELADADAGSGGPDTDRPMSMSRALRTLTSR